MESSRGESGDYGVGRHRPERVRSILHQGQGVMDIPTAADAAAIETAGFGRGGS